MVATFGPPLGQKARAKVGEFPLDPSGEVAQRRLELAVGLRPDRINALQVALYIARREAADFRREPVPVEKALDHRRQRLTGEFVRVLGRHAPGRPMPRYEPLGIDAQGTGKRLAHYGGRYSLPEFQTADMGLGDLSDAAQGSPGEAGGLSSLGQALWEALRLRRFFT